MHYTWAYLDYLLFISHGQEYESLRLELERKDAERRDEQEKILSEKEEELRLEREQLQAEKDRFQEELQVRGLLVSIHVH